MNFLDKIEFPNLFSGGIEVNRIAFSVFNIDIYWYGIIIALGVVLGFMFALKKSKSVGLIADKVFDVAFWGTLGGFVGARAYYCIFHNLNPANVNKYTFVTAITEMRDGGLAIYGGIIGAVITAIIVSRINKTRLMPLLDLAGPGFLIGQAIGRWGNFMNQEAFGAPTAGNLPWGMTGNLIAASPEVMEAQAALNQTGEYALVHPCFLYESLWCLLGFVLLYFYGKKLRSFDGEIFLLYIAWYGVGRGLIEGLRTDSLYAGDFRISRILGFISAGCAVALFIVLKIRSKKTVLYCNTEASQKMLSDYEAKIQMNKELASAKKAMKKQKKMEYEKAPSILAPEVTPSETEEEIEPPIPEQNPPKDE